MQNIVYKKRIPNTLVLSDFELCEKLYRRIVVLNVSFDTSNFAKATSDTQDEREDLIFCIKRLIYIFIFLI